MKRKIVRTTVANRHRIDAALARLAADRKPGQTFSQVEIAKACGISRGAVYLMEREAKKHLREKLRRALGLTWSQFMRMQTR